MRNNLLGLKRGTYLVLAVATALGALMPILNSKAYAYTQLTTRSIEMSSAAASNTGSSYLVSFTATTAAKNVRIDFCSNSPLYTDTCTAPGGFSASGATFTGGTQTGSGWSVASAAAAQVTVSNATTAYSAGAVTYTIGGITNPSAVGTFYARIYTYAAASNDYSTAASPGTVADFGGIALSTTNLISITAKVQETLTFCVSGAVLAPSTTCAGATLPTLTLGHGSPAVLDQTVDDVASAYTQVSTNANSGISMRMKSGNSCANGGLSSNGGTTCNIPGISGGTSSSVVLTPGTAGFGLFVAASSNNTTGTGTITPATTYNGNGHTTLPFTGPSDVWFGMNNTGVTSTYGDVIATSSAPTSLTNNQLVFGATAALTTQAGIYTVNESLITTGTF